MTVDGVLEQIDIAVVGLPREEAVDFLEDVQAGLDIRIEAMHEEADRAVDGEGADA
jgi:hypothetical protein